MAASKKSSEQGIVRVGDVPPQYLMHLAETDAGSESLETMRHHRVLNRVAVIQSNSPSEKKSKYGEAAAVIPATDTVFCRRDEQVEVVPVMFFDEFVQWGDRKDKEGRMIRETTLDRASVLAAKAQDRNRWYEPYGDNGQFKARNCHHLNFVCAVVGPETHPMRGQIVVLSFSRGEFRVGYGWIGKIQQRRIGARQAPIWTTRWKLSIGHRSNEDGEWFGVDVDQPDTTPWAAGEDLPVLENMHVTLKQEYKDKALSVGHEAAETVEGSPDASGETKF